MGPAFTATMIRPRYFPESIIARKALGPEFLHSLGQERTLAALDFMSAIGGKADVIAQKTDVRIRLGQRD